MVCRHQYLRSGVLIAPGVLVLPGTQGRQSWKLHTHEYTRTQYIHIYIIFGFSLCILNTMSSHTYLQFQPNTAGLILTFPLFIFAKFFSDSEKPSSFNSLLNLPYVANFLTSAWSPLTWFFKKNLKNLLLSFQVTK